MDYSSYTAPQLYHLLESQLGNGISPEALGIIREISRQTGTPEMDVPKLALRNLEGRRGTGLYEQAANARRAAEIARERAEAGRVAAAQTPVPENPLGVSPIYLQTPQQMPIDDLIQEVAETAVPPTMPTASAWNDVPQDIIDRINAGLPVDDLGGVGTGVLFDLDSNRRPMRPTVSPFLMEQTATLPTVPATPTANAGPLASLAQTPVESSPELIQELAESVQGTPTSPKSRYTSPRIGSLGENAPFAQNLSGVQFPELPSRSVTAPRASQSTPMRVNPDSIPGSRRPIPSSLALTGSDPLVPKLNSEQVPPSLDIESPSMGIQTPQLNGARIRKYLPSRDPLKDIGTEGLVEELASDPLKMKSGIARQTTPTGNRVPGSKGGLGGLFGNLFSPELSGNLKGIGDKIGNPQFNYTAGTGLKGWGKNLGGWYTGIKGGADAIGILNNLSDSAKEKTNTQDLQSDILTAAMSNPMSTYSLTSDQLKLLGDIRAGRRDVGGKLSDFDMGAGLKGAVTGALTGLPGGLTGAILGGLGGFAKEGTAGLAAGQQRRNAELEALYQTLNASNVDYKNAMRQRMMQRYF